MDFIDQQNREEVLGLTLYISGSSFAPDFGFLVQR
jgi:hypothetical protein